MTTSIAPTEIAIPIKSASMITTELIRPLLDQVVRALRVLVLW